MANRFAVRRVLLTDDNVDAAETLGVLLELMGFEVRITNDGDTAISAGREFLPQAVILDIGMPGLNGYDAARQIRQERWGCGVLLVAVTGYGQREDVQRSVNAGFHYHLTKPVEPDVIKFILDQWTVPGGSA